MQLGWRKCHSITFSALHREETGGGGRDLCHESMGEGGNKGVLTGREVLPPVHYIIFAKSCNLIVAKYAHIKIAI